MGWKYKSCSGLSAFYCSVLCCKLISAPLGEDCIKTIVSCNFGLPLTALMGCYSGNAKWVDISFCLHASFPLSAAEMTGRAKCWLSHCQQQAYQAWVQGK